MAAKRTNDAKYIFSMSPWKSASAANPPLARKNSAKKTICMVAKRKALLRKSNARKRAKYHSPKANANPTNAMLYAHSPMEERAYDRR
ncbi:Uncharacterised protein [uncultured archaeon]|nr:Uncharacterised protein [uncultured archaeon]